MKEVVINVNGMACTGCENRIKNALKSINGVKDVGANHVNGVVKITLDNDVNEEILKEKIEDIGFEVKED